MPITTFHDKPGLPEKQMSSTLGSLDTDASLNKIRVNHNLGLYLKVVASGGKTDQCKL